MRVCIHRGTKQIGGTCVEIEASGSRIIVDLGLPLDAVEADLALVPQISGLREHDPSLLVRAADFVPDAFAPKASASISSA